MPVKLSFFLAAHKLIKNYFVQHGRTYSYFLYVYKSELLDFYNHNYGQYVHFNYQEFYKETMAQQGYMDEQGFFHQPPQQQQQQPYYDPQQQNTGYDMGGNQQQQYEQYPQDQ